MAAPASPSHSFRLSPLEGLMPRAYVRQILCFPTTDSQAVSALSRGLSGLARDVPYVLSQIVNNTSGVVISGPCHTIEDIFSWHDLSASINYATLEAGSFAPGAFQTHGIIPPDTLPPHPASPAVFRARASLVDGGLTLCVAVHHAVTDITGYDALLKIWAAHCRDGSSLDIAFDPSWMNRDPLFPEAGSSPTFAPMPDLLHTVTPEESARRTGGPRVGETAQNYQTAIFHFPQQHLRALKDAANKYIASQEPGSWVSTSDILSSLLWKATIEAQEDSFLNTSETATGEDTRMSTLSFPVQFRSVLCPPLSRDFLGAAFVMTNARVPHKDVRLISSNSKSTVQGQESEVEAGMGVLANAVDISVLAKVALAIRRSIQRINDAAVRGVLAYLEAHPGTNPEAPIILGPPRHDAGGSGISVVSWADQYVYGLNWGDAVGRCDAVRLPKMGYKRDPIVLPRMSSDGGLEVIMSYEAGVMQRLIEGPVMRRFAVLRCLS